MSDWSSDVCSSDLVVHLVPTNYRTRTRLASTCTRTGQRPAARPAAASGPAKSSSRKRAFPAGPITLVVPWASGGVTDVGARILAPFVERELGERIIVVNRDDAQSPSLLTRSEEHTSELQSLMRISYA